jgi:hypothetical protein
MLSFELFPKARAVSNFLSNLRPVGDTERIAGMGFYYRLDHPLARALDMGVYLAEIEVLGLGVDFDRYACCRVTGLPEFTCVDAYNQ